MTKFLSVLVLIASIFSLVGCGKVYISSESQILYNENREPVQVFVFNNSLNLDGHIYNVYQTNGEYYVNAKTNFKQSGKIQLPELGTLEVDGVFGLDKLNLIFEPQIEDNFLPTDTGENFYQGEPVLSFYYLDDDAKYPVAVLTNTVDGEVVSSILIPITSLDGNKYIILSNDNSEYIYVPFDMNNPSVMLEQMAAYFAPNRKEFYYINSLNYDENNNPISAVVVSGFGTLGPINELKIEAPDDVVDNSDVSDFPNINMPITGIHKLIYTFDVHIDDNGKTYLVIPDVNGEFIYIAFDSEDVGKGNVGLAGAIVIPYNIIDHSN